MRLTNFLVRRPVIHEDNIIVGNAFHTHCSRHVHHGHQGPFVERLVPKELSYRQVPLGVGALVVGDPGMQPLTTHHYERRHTQVLEHLPARKSIYFSSSEDGKGN
jgi:hypothetical protein